MFGPPQADWLLNIICYLGFGIWDLIISFFSPAQHQLASPNGSVTRNTPNPQIKDHLNSSVLI
jgi:hypothetical protein